MEIKISIFETSSQNALAMIFDPKFMNIIESVGSICRDSADMQYMLIQQTSQNLQNS